MGTKYELYSILLYEISLSSLNIIKDASLYYELVVGNYIQMYDII